MIIYDGVTETVNEKKSVISAVFAGVRVESDDLFLFFVVTVFRQSLAVFALYDYRFCSSEIGNRHGVIVEIGNRNADIRSDNFVVSRVLTKHSDFFVF